MVTRASKEPEQNPRGALTRRELLANSTGVALSAGLTGAVAGCGGPAIPAVTASPPAVVPTLLAQMANPAAAVSTGDAWIAFCEALKPLARHVTGPESLGHPQIQTEGIRCLSRMVSLGLDRFVEHGDPRHPAFYDLQTATRKYLGDNPDQSYRGAAIEASGTYRVRGNAAGAAGVEIGVYAGSFRSDASSSGGGRRMVDSLDEQSLAIEDDGSFELVLRRGQDGAERGRNELRLEDDANAILIRTYFWDRGLREFHVMPTIERVDVEGPAPPLDPAMLLKGFLATAMFVDGSLEWWNRFEGIQTGTNQLIVMPDDGSVQTPSLVRYLNGRVELSEDQAFVLAFDATDGPDYWSWVLQNVWGETPDWRDRPIVLNNRDVVPEADGRVRIVISHSNPGVPNWMDMAGHPRLLLSLRWRGEQPLPSVSTRTTTLAELRG